MLAVLLIASPALAACATAEDAVAQAEEHLEEGLRQAHERALSERAADPERRDQAAADRLAAAISGGNPGLVIASTTTRDGVEVLSLLSARGQVGGGGSYHQATLGACLRTRAWPGSADAAAGGRGTVVTEAVRCPEGAARLVGGLPVDAFTTELRTLRSDVPPPKQAPCLSGSGDCVGG